MARRRLKSPLWVPPGGSQVDFARRWISEQLELDHLVDLTPAGIAAATGVHRHTAAKAIKGGPLPFHPGFRPVRRDLVDLVLPARSKIIATNLYQRGEPDRHQYLPSLKDLAGDLGWRRNAVQRALRPARAGGLVIQEVVAVHGNRTYVRRWCRKVGTGTVEKRVRGLSKSGYGDCRKVGTGTSCVQSPPSTRGLASFGIDISDRTTWPTWAQNGGGGKDPLWMMLPSRAVAGSLPAHPDPLELEGVLRAPGVTLARSLAQRLAIARIERDELVQIIEQVRDARFIRQSRAALFAGLLLAWLREHE